MPRKTRRKKISPRKLEQTVQEVLQDRQDPKLDPAEVEMELLDLMENEEYAD